MENYNKCINILIDKINLDSSVKNNLIAQYILDDLSSKNNCSSEFDYLLLYFNILELDIHKLYDINYINNTLFIT